MFDGTEIVLAMGIVVECEILEVPDGRDQGCKAGVGDGPHPTRCHYEATGFGKRQGATKFVVERPDRCTAGLLIGVQHGFTIFG